jgi:hypothetical protein
LLFVFYRLTRERRALSSPKENETVSRSSNNTGSTRSERCGSASGHASDAQTVEKVAPVAAPTSVENTTPARRELLPLASLFTEQSDSELRDIKEGEFLLIERFRQIREAGESREARARFEAGQLLETEVYGELHDCPSSTLDASSNPALFFLSKLVARWVSSYRPSWLFDTPEDWEAVPSTGTGSGRLIAEYVVDLFYFLLKEIHLATMDDLSREEQRIGPMDDALDHMGRFSLDSLPNLMGGFCSIPAVEVFADGLYGGENLPWNEEGAGSGDRMETLFRALQPIAHTPRRIAEKTDIGYFLMIAFGAAAHRFNQLPDSELALSDDAKGGE